MIKRSLFYYVECDGCDAELRVDNYYLIHCSVKINMIEELENAEWKKEGRDWFCLECQENVASEEEK